MGKKTVTGVVGSYVDDKKTNNETVTKTTAVADTPKTTTDTTSSYLPTSAVSTSYSSPSYDPSKYNVDTSYYTDAIAKYTEAQEKNRANQTAQADTQKTNALREAYISKMQNQKTLNDNLSRLGIRGGATETSNLKLAANYGQQRNAANTDYTNSINAINQAIDANILNYDMDMTSRAEEYRQNLAQALWQAEREDYANMIAQQNADREYNLALANYQLSQQESAANIANTQANTAATEASVYRDNWNNLAKSLKTSDDVTKEIKKLKKNKDNYSEEEYNYAINRLKKRRTNLQNAGK